MDSTYSYIHFSNPNQVVYFEKWKDDDPIPYDDVETDGLFDATASLFPQSLLEEEEDGGIPLNAANFNSRFHKNKSLMKERVWQDLDIHSFLSENAENRRFHDKTILKPLHDKPPAPEETSAADELTVAQFLANGYARTEDILDYNESHTSDISLNISDFVVPNNTFFTKNRNNSNGNIQTPRVRNRQASTERNYQTPVSRMSRRNFTE